MRYKFIKTKAVLQIIIMITAIFTIYLLNAKEVKAQTSVNYCCEQTKAGKFCQDINDPSVCATTPIANVNCAQTATCKPGTCFIEKDCSENVGKYNCEHIGGGGKWDARPQNQVPECQKACCKIGTECGLKTKAKCGETAETFDLNVNDVWKTGIIDERACIDECNREAKTCCVITQGENKVCQYTTFGACDSLGGEKQGENVLCQNVGVCQQQCPPDEWPEPETDCGKTVDIVEDVYEYDKCGDYKLKDHGNCDLISQGTICGDTNKDGKGDACINVNCGSDVWNNPVTDEDGTGDSATETVDRKYGDSWCEYQAAVGPGMDLPGTTHYRHYCDRGKEVVEQCSSDRSEICIYGPLTITNPEGLFVPIERSVGGCIENPASECIECEEDEDCCNGKGLCLWAGETGGKGKCVPLVPPAGSSSCDKGSFTIAEAAYWEKPCGSSSWSCKQPGDCEQPYGKDTLKGLNFLCKTYGDCGAGWNLAGSLEGNSLLQEKAFTNKGFERDCRHQGNIDNQCSGHGDRPEYTEQNPQRVTKKLFPYSDVKDAKQGLKVLAIDLSVGGRGYVDVLRSWGRMSGALIAGVGAFIGLLVYLKVAAVASAFGPYGWVVAAVIIVVGVVVWLITEFCGDSEKRGVDIKCKAWEPPEGGDLCELCHTKDPNGLLPDYDKFYCDPSSSENPEGCEDIEAFKEGQLVPWSYTCTEQMCNSLGTWCNFTQTTEGPKCISVPPTDVSTPRINIDTTNTKYTCNIELPEEIGGCSINALTNGAKIEGKIDDVQKKVTIAITTDKVAICKFSDNIEDFGAMDYYFSGGSAGTSLSYEFNGLTAGQTYKYYVKCQGLNERANDVPYSIEFTIARQPDTTAPAITSFSPESPAYIAYDKDNLNIVLNLSEEVKLDSPTEFFGGCRWSNTPNTAFDIMTNYLSCSSPSPPNNPAQCRGTLTGINPGQNIFYFRCMDRENNVNTQDWPSNGYTVTRTGPLNITSTYPKNEEKLFVKSINMTVTTSGGAEAGKATCEYGYGDTENYLAGEFFETNANAHRQELTFQETGTQNYYIKCHDIAGNEAKEKITFLVTTDTTSPEIISVTKSENRLKLTLKDETLVTCYYDTKDSYFGEGTKMITIKKDDIYENYADYGKGVYYMKCQDNFDNPLELIVYAA